MEKASLERIIRLLEIIEGEHSHELLLSVKNLKELSVSPFPYIAPVIPRPLLAELVKGEHFTLVDLLKSILGSSLQAGSAQEPLAQKPHVKTVQETLTSFVWPCKSPLDEQDSRPTP